MRLYMVEEMDNANLGVFFYWAENEGDALDRHETQVLNPDVEWVASPVFANNLDARYRGFVVQS